LSDSNCHDPQFGDISPGRSLGAKPFRRDRRTRPCTSISPAFLPSIGYWTLAGLRAILKGNGLEKMPLLKNEWVEMGDLAPPRRRTHGGAGAGALAVVQPSPPKAVTEGHALRGQASSPTIATGGPMSCSSRPCARAKSLAGRYITHSKFKRVKKIKCCHHRRGCRTLKRRDAGHPQGAHGGPLSRFRGGVDHSTRNRPIAMCSPATKYYNHDKQNQFSNPRLPRHLRVPITFPHPHRASGSTAR
jgi:hypothetical protein